MIAKFNREIIASINEKPSAASNRNHAIHNKSVAVPEKETFKSVLENAKKGNEMAAVLLDEWQRSCTAKDEKEEQVLKCIHKAANTLFDRQISTRKN